MILQTIMFIEYAYNDFERFGAFDGFVRFVCFDDFDCFSGFGSFHICDDYDKVG